ncbi:hypothetical protein [Actinophytocola xanthii]|uniref:Lipoprotein n=1 Tax=Actinophytocola xanthii TaxID=1912961 RepID=A0A1Q8CXD0_9PSEU|nr:hypothetical protein [Actinophytocola xanthii]OLF19016.1 hypothetical protein BU204_03975 [Actinophytocola xanthii]
MRSTVLVVTAVVALLLAGCGGDEPSGTQPAHRSDSGHSHQHSPEDDPNLAPAGDSGTPALGQPVETMAELSTWVREVTGECHPVNAASRAELVEYLGPVRGEWYAPFVAQWATCGIEPFDELGLVLFEPGQQRALQEFWRRGLAEGRIADNPDWAFGNGFAITAGTLGTERLGLRYLWCEPVAATKARTVPADVEGCVYATAG